MVFLFFTFFLFVVDLVASVSNVTYTNTLYIITNAETPSLNLPGLTPVGKQRAEVCLPEVSFCVVQSLDDEVLMPLYTLALQTFEYRLHCYLPTK